MNRTEQILREAYEVGKEALLECKPSPVRFYSADLAGNQIGESCVESEGNCGGAYIKGIQYRSELYKFFKTLPDWNLEGICSMSKDVYSGYSLHFSHDYYRGQSFDRYVACADAIAAHLCDHGLPCRTHSYLT